MLQLSQLSLPNTTNGICNKILSTMLLPAFFSAVSWSRIINILIIDHINYYALFPSWMFLFYFFLKSNFFCEEIFWLLKFEFFWVCWCKWNIFRHFFITVLFLKADWLFFNISLYTLCLAVCWKQIVNSIIRTNQKLSKSIKISPMNNYNNIHFDVLFESFNKFNSSKSLV